MDSFDDYDDTDQDKPGLDKPKMGRRPYERNEKDEGALTALLSVGFPHRQICLYMGRNIATLKKHYADIFETVMNTEDKTTMVENSLFYLATHKLNVVACLAWLKAHRKELYSERYQAADAPDDTNKDFLKSLSKVLSNAHKDKA